MAPLRRIRSAPRVSPSCPSPARGRGALARPPRPPPSSPRSPGHAGPPWRSARPRPRPARRPPRGAVSSPRPACSPAQSPVRLSPVPGRGAVPFSAQRSPPRRARPRLSPPGAWLAGAACSHGLPAAARRSLPPRPQRPSLGGPRGALASPRPRPVSAATCPPRAARRPARALGLSPLPRRLAPTMARSGLDAVRPPAPTRPPQRAHGGSAPALARHSPCAARPRPGVASALASAVPLHSAARAQLGPSVCATRSRRVSVALRAHARVVRAVLWHGSSCPPARSSTPGHARLPPVYLMRAKHVIHINKWKLNLEIGYFSYFM
jgi:hypothetical protein